MPEVPVHIPDLEPEPSAGREEQDGATPAADSSVPALVPTDHPPELPANAEDSSPSDGNTPTFSPPNWFDGSRGKLTSCEYLTLYVCVCVFEQLNT